MHHTLVAAPPQGPLPCRLLRPDADRLPGVVLLNLAADAQRTLYGFPFRLPVDAFLGAGHAVASFDLPFHGERLQADGSAGIKGFYAACRDGVDPFAQVVCEVEAVISTVLASGLVDPAAVVVIHGTSRGGYCALRAAAHLQQVAAVAAVAPVTDWRVLREFAGRPTRVDTGVLVLDRWATALAGRHLFVTIGNADHRVGTDCCLSFLAAVAAAERHGGVEKSRLRAVIDDRSNGHSVALRYRVEAADSLLRAAARAA